MTRFVALLLLIGGLIYGWLFLQRKQAENRARAHAAQLAPHLADLPLSLDAAETAQKGEANMYWILAYFDKLVREGMEPGKVLEDACDQISLPSEKASVLRSNVMANYETAKKYGLFEDVTNVVKMEQGLPPVMKMSGWEEEPVTVTYMIPPSIAPEAAGVTANFVLMPGIVNDAQGTRITANILEQARAMERAKIITKPSLEELMTLAKQSSPAPR